MKRMLTTGKTLRCHCSTISQPHTYIGIQDFPHNGDRFHLWTCCNCGTTRTERIYDAADFCEVEQEAALMATGRM